jgi:hypothetical protein
MILATRTLSTFADVGSGFRLDLKSRDDGVNIVFGLVATNPEPSARRADPLHRLMPDILMAAFTKVAFRLLGFRAATLGAEPRN